MDEPLDTDEDDADFDDIGSFGPLFREELEASLITMRIRLETRILTILTRLPAPVPPLRKRLGPYPMRKPIRLGMQSLMVLTILGKAA